MAKLQEGSRLELTVRRHVQTNQIVVHLVNYSGQANDNFEAPVLQHGLKLGVRGAASGQAKALVSGQSCAVSAADAQGYRWIDVPPVGHMEALIFEADTPR